MELQGTCWPYSGRKWVEAPIADDVGSQIAEGNQHEGPVPHPRMGNDQIVLLDDAVADQQDIDVEGSGSPALEPDPVGLCLCSLGGHQKLAGRPVRGQLDHQIEEGQLAGRAADRVGLVDGRDPDDVGEPGDPVAEVLPAVTEVRAEAEEGPSVTGG